MKCPLKPFTGREMFTAIQEAHKMALPGTIDSADALAKVTNSLMEARWKEVWENAPEVFGFVDGEKFIYQCSVQTKVDTHRARLFGITEVEGKE